MTYDICNCTKDFLPQNSLIYVEQVEQVIALQV